MKAVLRVYIDPDTGEPIPLPWFGEGEPPVIVETEDQSANRSNQQNNEEKKPS
jgi:hypothetical protein